MPRIASDSTSRFPVQIPQPMKARLLRAAALENASLKDFMLSTALRAAEEVIEKAEKIHLNETQSKFLLDLLDSPPAPNARLLAAARALVSEK